MKMIRSMIIIVCLIINAAFAQIEVNISVNTSEQGYLIPDDFIGFSFETRRVLYNSPGVSGYFFDSSNKQLITLFRQLGVKSLRVGGGSVDSEETAIPTLKDIDALFGFARAADVKVIYSLRLNNGDPDQNASIARYIWTNYLEHFDCFTIGNESSHYLKDYSEFRGKWKKMADAITASVPDAKFCGPAPVSSMDGGAYFISEFAKDFAKTGLIKFVTAHDYPGGSAWNAANGASGRDQMLSRAWLDHYKVFYDQFVPTVLANNLTYKYDEGSSFYKGGVKDASNTFASSLWVLDYMHWWASHGCVGYNFHNNRWYMYNITICQDSEGNYQVRPQGYGIKAFDIGGYGRVVKLNKSHQHLNVTAYGVVNGNDLYVTIINKEHDEYGRDINVSIEGDNFSNSGQVMYLLSPNGDVAATTGITLGGATINNTGTWQGKWTSLKSSESGNIEVPVSAASAAIVKIGLEN